MQRKLLYLVGLALLASACTKDDYERGQRSQTNDAVRIEAVPGRVASAYVTYYGTSSPDPKAFTHINYSFAELIVKEGRYVAFQLQGDTARFRKIVALKNKNHDLKISLAFTHTIDNANNQQGGGFSLIAASPEYRRAFAEDCLECCRMWGIDGIDIDWEFPGLSWSGHACDPQHDVENYTLLLKELRQTLGDQYLLTFAGYVKDVQPIDANDPTAGRKYIDLAAAAPYADFINVMTYDMDSAPNHQSAIRDPKAYWDCERAIQAYLDAGVPASKIVLGIPFYGRRSFDGSETAIDYRKIVGMDAFTYTIDNWDAEANVPYVTRNGEYYCGYDNARSIAIKGEWAHELGLKGMMCWDYDGDDNSGTLRTALWNAVMKP